MTLREIKAEIASLQRKEYLVATNAGTYSSREAQRSVGSGDPAVSTRNVYETVEGLKRATGPADDAAPGQMRNLSRAELTADHRRLAELLKALEVRP